MRGRGLVVADLPPAGWSQSLTSQPHSLCQSTSLSVSQSASQPDSQPVSQSVHIICQSVRSSVVRCRCGAAAPVASVFPQLLNRRRINQGEKLSLQNVCWVMFAAAVCNRDCTGSNSLVQLLSCAACGMCSHPFLQVVNCC